MSKSLGQVLYENRLPEPPIDAADYTMPSFKEPYASEDIQTEGFVTLAEANKLADEIFNTTEPKVKARINFVSLDAVLEIIDKHLSDLGANNELLIKVREEIKKEFK
jgi:hypothetical protein